MGHYLLVVLLTLPLPLSLSLSFRSDCRKVYEEQQGRSTKTPTTMKCIFCNEDIKPIWEAMKEHSEVCGPGTAAAAARVVAAAAAAQKQHRQQKELQQQLQQQQQQQPGQTRQGSTMETVNGGGRSALSGSVSGSSDGAISGAGLAICCSSHEGGSNNDVTTVGRGGKASPSPPPFGQLLPLKLKRRSSSSNNTFGRRGSTGSSPSALVLDRQRSAESFSSYSGRALGSDSDSSDSDFEGGMGGGVGGLGGGTGGNGTGSSILGATRRPMPPKKRWETEFEAWAKGGEGFDRDANGEVAENVGVKGSFVGVTTVRQGGIGKDSSIGVEKRYPCLMDRARDSALLTVREVRRVKLGGEGGDDLVKSESGEECEAIVECSMMVTRGKVDVSETPL